MRRQYLKVLARRTATILAVVVWSGVLARAQSGANALPAQPTELAAAHRSGQTFITFKERSELVGETYRIYRHDAPIEAGTLAQSTLLHEVAEGTGRFFANRYNADNSGVWEARYVDRFVVADG